jgi:hypothetical protein
VRGVPVHKLGQRGTLQNEKRNAGIRQRFDDHADDPPPHNGRASVLLASGKEPHADRRRDRGLCFADVSEKKRSKAVAFAGLDQVDVRRCRRERKRKLFDAVRVSRPLSAEGQEPKRFVVWLRVEASKCRHSVL